MLEDTSRAFTKLSMSRGATGELAKLFIVQAGGGGTIPTFDGGRCPDAVTSKCKQGYLGGTVRQTSNGIPHSLQMGLRRSDWD